MSTIRAYYVHHNAVTQQKLLYYHSLGHPEETADFLQMNPAKSDTTVHSNSRSQLQIM